MQSFFRERSEELDINFYPILGKEIQNKLSDFIEDNPTDLLVMYQPHHDFWDRLFHKSITKKMALHTNVPLLVVKSD